MADRDFDGWAHFRQLDEMSSGERNLILDRDLGLKEQFLEWRQLKERRAEQTIPITDYLSADDFKKVHAAISAANFAGRTLTSFLTINWRLLGSDEVKAAQQFKALRSRIQWWMRDRKVPWLGVYVWENPVGGLNSHLLFHLPVELLGPDKRTKGYDRRERGFRPWLDQAMLDLIELPELPKGAYLLQWRDANAFPGQWVWFRYMMKGLDPDAWVRDADRRLVRLWELAGLELEKQGRVSGKRAGTTRNLGFRRLRQAGYQPPLGRGVWHAEQLYGDYAFQVGRGRRKVNAEEEPSRIVDAIIALQTV